MQIQQISVRGLFGIFDHVIALNMEERITIIHGPNGFGKTVMLRMLNGFFNSHYSVFRTIPFSNLRVEFDNGSSVEVVKASENSERTQKKIISLSSFTKMAQKNFLFLSRKQKILPI